MHTDLIFIWGSYLRPSLGQTKLHTSADSHADINVAILISYLYCCVNMILILPELDINVAIQWSSTPPLIQTKHRIKRWCTQSVSIILSTKKYHSFVDTYESLIPNIFMRLYPTFTITMEVVNRLIQRYLAFVPIEPGGVGCLETNENEVNSGAQWSEALSVLQFLLKLVSGDWFILCKWLTYIHNNSNPF